MPILGFLLVFPILTCFSATIHVPLEAPTIQAGIDAASEGDIVMISDGVYTGEGNRDVSLRGKAITVRSENGAAGCVMNCEGQGRGFYLDENDTANAEIRDLTITGGLAVEGGAIYCDHAAVTFIGLVVSGNSALSYGGGFHIWEADVSLKDCSFLDNTSSSFGGGIHSRYSRLGMTGCLFRSNTAYRGGGVYLTGDTRGIRYCRFESNTAQHIGGGADITGNEIDISDCIFSSNTAEIFGGLHIQSNGSVVMSRCTFAGNSAVHHGGGMGAFLSESFLAVNCLFHNNIADRHGACMPTTYDPCHFIHCSFISNRSRENFPVVGDYIRNPLICIGNSIERDNQPAFVPDDSRDRYVIFSAVERSLPGIGNIHSDPGLIGGDPFDPRLRPDSPCIDAGRSGYEIPVDLDGNPRLQGGACDIGAYESSYRPATPHIYLSMPAHRFFPGDPVSLTAQIWNPSTETIRNAPVFVILEYLDAYYFMPGGGDISFYTIDCPAGTIELGILPEFAWPDIPQSLDQALWYGAVLDAGLTQMVSNLCVYDFDWRHDDEPW